MSKKVVKTNPITTVGLDQITDKSLVAFKYLDEVNVVLPHPTNSSGFGIVKVGLKKSGSRYTSSSFDSVKDAAAQILNHSSNHDLRLFGSLHELADHYNL